VVGHERDDHGGGELGGNEAESLREDGGHHRHVRSGQYVRELRVSERPDEHHGVPEPPRRAQQESGGLEVPQGSSRAALQQPAAFRQAPGVPLVARVERPDQRLQSLAEGAEPYDQQAGPGLLVHRGEGGDEAVDTLGVNKLAQVDDQGYVRAQEGRQAVTGVPVVGAGIVGARDLFEAPELSSFSSSARCWSGPRPRPPFREPRTVRSRASGRKRSVSTPPGRVRVLPARWGRSSAMATKREPPTTGTVPRGW
jgi:hypothetical protein